jgi:hypothetical protein
MLKRREILGALGMSAAGIALWADKTLATAAQSGDDDPKHAGMKKSCCDACGECAQACNKAFHHCVEQAAGGKPRHAKMAQTVADCAAFCALSAEMISRQSMMMSGHHRAWRWVTPTRGNPRDSATEIHGRWRGHT